MTMFMAPPDKREDDDQIAENDNGRRITGGRVRLRDQNCWPRRSYAACTPASESHSRIFCLGMAPTFIEVIWPPRNSIIVGMPRTP